MNLEQLGALLEVALLAIGDLQDRVKLLEETLKQNGPENS